VIWGRRDANTVRLTKCKNMYKYVPRFRWWKTWRTYFPTLWYGILQEQKLAFRIHGSSSSYKTKSNYSKGIYTPPEDNLAHYIDVLRNQEQCSYIIIIAHLLSQQIVGKQTRMWGVNYILRWYAKYVNLLFANIQSGGTWAFGSFIGKLDLTIQNGKVISDIWINWSRFT
jgi:hypothetical protein